MLEIEKASDDGSKLKLTITNTLPMPVRINLCDMKMRSSTCFAFLLFSEGDKWLSRRYIFGGCSAEFVTLDSGESVSEIADLEYPFPDVDSYIGNILYVSIPYRVPIDSRLYVCNDYMIP